MTLLVELVSVRVDVDGNLGLQRRSEHRTRTITDDLISWNENAAPFEWTATADEITRRLRLLT